MKHIIHIIVFLFSANVMSQLTIDVEGSYAFQDYNEVQVPKPSGTLFDLNRDFQLQQPAIAPRLRLTYSFGKNNISALFSPLTTTYEGISPKDIRFEGVQVQGIAPPGFYCSAAAFPTDPGSGRSYWGVFPVLHRTPHRGFCRQVCDLYHQLMGVWGHICSGDGR